MSMRYADTPVPPPTENIPALPGVRADFRPTHARTESEGSIRIKREKKRRALGPPGTGCWINKTPIRTFVSVLRRTPPSYES